MRPLALLLILLLTSCRTPTTPTELKGVAMGMDYSILIGEPLSPAKRAQVQSVIETLFDEINTTYNNWNPDSEVSQLNALPAHQQILLSPPLYAFLERVGSWVERSHGLFDPTVAPLQRLWRERLLARRVPSEEELEALRPAVGWGRIHLEEGRFWKEDDRTSLDLGGVAKGYAVDLLTERLQALGLHHLFVNWSGEVRTSDGHPAGRPWRIAIQAPVPGAPPTPITTIEMESGALATSGNYHQAWPTDQGLYTHICNPLTLSALAVKHGGVASTTVQAESCFVADLLATALMICDNCDDAAELISHLSSDAQAWIFSGSYQLLDE